MLPLLRFDVNKGVDVGCTGEGDNPSLYCAIYPDSYEFYMLWLEFTNFSSVSSNRVELLHG